MLQSLFTVEFLSAYKDAYADDYYIFQEINILF
jgi:hypothetical protein